MRYLHLLKREFQGYNAKSLTADLLSGITVAAVALPLALAFGVSSGADAMTRLADNLKRRGARLILTGLPERAKLMADRCGLTEAVGSGNFYRAMDRAILGYHAEAQNDVED